MPVLNYLIAHLQFVQHAYIYRYSRRFESLEQNQVNL